MLSGLRLQNFKKFSDYRIKFDETNIFVGPNNAGKSSVLDALRVLSDFLNYANRRIPRVKSQGKHGVCASYQITNSMLSIPVENITRNYSEELAVIEARIPGGNVFRIELSPDTTPEGFLVTSNRRPQSIAAFKKAFPVGITIVPTLSPFEEIEPLISDARVKEIRSSRLASRNFRNVWARRTKEEFGDFEAVISEVWPNIRIKFPERYTRNSKTIMQMFYREETSEREIYWAGFGFQVWLQTISQIIISGNNNILVLDEPDVYLHPDLQKRLIDFAKSRFKQIAVATHSTEIINHVESRDIKIIDSSINSAKLIKSTSSYNQLFAYLGSSENVEYARLSKAKKIIFFEGNDRRLLRKFLKKAGFEDVISDPSILLLKTGGFGGWSKVRDSEWVLKQTLGIDVKIFALFDRDYICDEELEEIVSKDTSDNVAFHVLNKKEIENYCLNVAAIDRLCRKLFQKKEIDYPDDLTSDLLAEITDDLKVSTRGLLQENYQNYLVERAKRQKKSIPTTVKMTNEFLVWFDDMWSELDSRLSYVSGKKVLARFSLNISEKYGVNLSWSKILDEIDASEIDEGLIGVLHSLVVHFR